MPSSIHRITDLDPVQGGMGYVSTCRLLSSRKSTRGAHRRARETGTVPYHPRTRFHPCTAAARVVSSSHPCPDVFLLLFTHTAEPPHLRCSHLAFTDQNRETKMRNVSKRSISLALHTTSLSLGGAAATCRPSASMLGSGPTPADVLSVTESAFSDNRIRSKF